MRDKSLWTENEITLESWDRQAGVYKRITNVSSEWEDYKLIQYFRNPEFAFKLILSN